MLKNQKGEVTYLLEAWRDGERDALYRLIPLIEKELRVIAKIYMAQERRDHTLQPTALVNELFLRLVKPDQVSWQNRAHFLGFAAQTMRRILVDHVRRRRAKMRNEGVSPVSLDELRDHPADPDQELLDLDEALGELKNLDPRHSRAVELYHFAGLNYSEIATVLGCSKATAKRALTAGRAWLRRELRTEADRDSS